MRNLQDGDFAAIARLCNGENAWRTGTVVRDADTWKGFSRSVDFFTKPAVRVALDDRDRFKGYVVCDNDPAQCRPLGIFQRSENDYRLRC